MCIASVHADIHVCLCVGANVYAGEHAFVFICMWRPEVDVMSLSFIVYSIYCERAS